MHHWVSRLSQPMLCKETNCIIASRRWVIPESKVVCVSCITHTLSSTKHAERRKRAFFFFSALPRDDPTDRQQHTYDRLDPKDRGHTQALGGRKEGTRRTKEGGERKAIPFLSCLWPEAAVAGEPGGTRDRKEGRTHHRCVRELPLTSRFCELAQPTASDRMRHSAIRLHHRHSSSPWRRLEGERVVTLV